jgi:hypothetical protein
MPTKINAVLLPSIPSHPNPTRPGYDTIRRAVTEQGRYLQGATVKGIRAIALILFNVAAFFTVAVARAEPIIVFDSRYNRDYAISACSPLRKAFATPTAVSDCQNAVNTREVGRQFEYKVRSRFAVNTRCKSVSVVLLELDASKGAVNTQKPYWSLVLYYRPGSKVHAWELFRADKLGYITTQKVKGEGTPAQIANEACIAVTGQGANIP